MSIIKYPTSINENDEDVNIAMKHSAEMAELSNVGL